MKKTIIIVISIILIVLFLALPTQTTSQPMTGEQIATNQCQDALILYRLRPTEKNKNDVTYFCDK